MDESRTQNAANGDDHSSPGASLRQAMSQINELRQYAAHYLSARIDSLKLTVRNVFLWTAIALLALLMALSVVVTAIVIFCMGLAEAIAALLGGRMWAGNLIVGVALIATIFLCIWMGVKRLFASSLIRTAERYERKLRRQRVDLGHDAHERAAESDAEND